MAKTKAPKTARRARFKRRLMAGLSAIATLSWVFSMSGGMGGGIAPTPVKKAAAASETAARASSSTARSAASSAPAGSAASAVDGASVLDELFKARRSDVQVDVLAPVLKILKDDLDGSRHQRFLLRTPAGRTVLVAHNIDLAPRIAGLAQGHEVRVAGEYEWNSKGGVVHWTHHDPRGRHPGGFVEHRGQRYE